MLKAFVSWFQDVECLHNALNPTNLSKITREISPLDQNHISEKTIPGWILIIVI